MFSLLRFCFVFYGGIYVKNGFLFLFLFFFYSFAQCAADVPLDQCSSVSLL